MKITKILLALIFIVSIVVLDKVSFGQDLKLLAGTSKVNHENVNLKYG